MKKAVLLAAGLTLMTAPALAHSGHGSPEGFLSGFHHPFGGADHLLAMVAVGLWAGMRGGAPVWMWPSAFVAAMLAGFALSVAGVVLPLYEPMILASLVGLGLAIALGVRMPVFAGAAMVALFGLFHGYAHGIEITGAVLSFAAGFVAASVLLLAAGIAIAAGARQTRLSLALRAAGATVALAGIVLPALEYLK